MARGLRRNWFWLGVNVAAAIPLMWLLWDMAAGNLSVNPIDDITDRTGKAAIILLLLSLACTPAHIVAGWRQPIQVRKALGLWAFAYATFHLLNFVGNDYLFDVQMILRDGIATKPFVVVGFLAFLLLIPLAITSTRGWMRRMGRKWKTLHNLVYVIAPLAVVHFLWLAKAAEDWEPLLYGAIVALLLLVRIPPVRRRFVSARRTKPARAPAAGRTPAAGHTPAPEQTAAARRQHPANAPAEAAPLLEANSPSSAAQ